MKNRRQGSDFRQSIEGFGPGYRHEGYGSQQTEGRHLGIAVFDTVQVEYRERIGTDQTLEGQDLVLWSMVALSEL